MKQLVKAGWLLFILGIVAVALIVVTGGCTDVNPQPVPTPQDDSTKAILGTWEGFKSSYTEKDVRYSFTPTGEVKGYRFRNNSWEPEKDLSGTYTVVENKSLTISRSSGVTTYTLNIKDKVMFWTFDVKNDGWPYTAVLYLKLISIP